MGLFIIIGLVFFISPLLGVVVCFSLLVVNKFKTNSINIIIYFYLSLFLGLINTLKIPESDLEYYIELFNNCKNQSFVDYVISFGREPLFMVFNYIVYKLTFGSIETYLIIFTVFCYFLVFFSIGLIHNKIKLSHGMYILAIGCTFLFPNMFTLSVHLMRQFMAASLILFLLVSNVFYGKKYILVLVSAILIHTTSIIFLILYIPFFKTQIKQYLVMFWMFIFACFVFVFYNYSDLLLSVFQGIPVLSYLFSRINKVEEGWTTDNLGIINFLLQFFIVFVFYIINSKKLIKGLNFQKIYIISFVLLIFIAINYNNTEIALRFSFYMYFLFPISLYFLRGAFVLNSKSVVFEPLFVILVLFIFVIWFIFKLQNGIWEYINLESLI